MDYWLIKKIRPYWSGRCTFATLSLIIAVVLALVFITTNSPGESAKHFRSSHPPETIEDSELLLRSHFRKRSDKTVEIIAFIDFMCPHCAKILPSLKKLADQEPDVDLVLRHFPN
jgi:thiol-disulfide isomerase/thioredoxin